MRRIGADEWSGLAMLVVLLTVAGPALLGVVTTTIARGAWIALFVVLLAALLHAAAARPSVGRSATYATAALASWALVLTSPGTGLLPILLVVVAAIGVHVVPLRVVLVVVGLSTAVIALAMAQQAPQISETLITAGFYLLIQLATVMSTVALIREQRLRRELTEAHIGLQAATVLLSESARTAERLRISRDLHDLIGHQLTVLTLELETARHRDGEQAREHVERANGVARELLADVRATVGELRTGSPDLAGALQQVVRDVPGLEVSIAVDVAVPTGEEQTIALVRAVQEIVTNTLRHAGASALRITITSEGSDVVLTATDDGAGARGPVPGNGIRGLSERFAALGGAVTVDGGAGFPVTARMPAA